MVAKKKKPTAAPPEAMTTIVEQIGDMLKSHWKEFEQVLEDSETNKATWTFAVKIDNTEGKSLIQTVGTFSETHKDKRSKELDDPRQGKLLEVPDKKTDFKMKAANDDSNSD
jgi:phage host-nuclease inhibitor protein Gam